MGGRGGRWEQGPLGGVPGATDSRGGHARPKGEPVQGPGWAAGWDQAEWAAGELVQSPRIGGGCSGAWSWGTGAGGREGGAVQLCV